MLSLQDIVVAVPDGPDTLTILDKLSLSVDAGEVVAVTGTSGSGKSTLLAVAGLLRAPTSGTITIAGTPTSGLSSRNLTAQRRHNIGFVFQSANLFPSLTALEQLELVAHINHDLNKTTRKRARQLLINVGLEARLKARPAQLSGGERQRVGIARSLMANPTVLLADEPTAALDDTQGREITALLADEATKQGAATIIVTHSPAQLPAGTTIYRLEGGRALPVSP